MKTGIKHLMFAILMTLSVSGACSYDASIARKNRFVTVDGVNLRTPDGEKLFIKGTNLGNWLNPEGYMFGFSNTSSPRLINEMLCSLVGPDFTAEFWKTFKDNYITEDDIRFIAEQGANVIRVPFNYRIFTDEDYMGLSSCQDGFARIDSLVEWCRKAGLYVILDMHDAPGGQTGDNIDDSYGYPWLFENVASRQLCCKVWKNIAKHYRNEPVILGYDLLNEPIAPYFDKELLNPMLEPMYKEIVAAIREVDKNHIVLLGGAQWNGNFSCFADWNFDDKMMYTCHRYGGKTDADAIRSIIEFRDRTGLPMYMGEIGHNTDEWQSSFCRTMIENNIGYTFWPYKKMGGSCWNSSDAPKGWRLIVDFSNADRSSFGAIRKNRPDQQEARKILLEYLESVKFINCTPQKGYIESLLLKKL